MGVRVSGLCLPRTLKPHSGLLPWCPGRPTREPVGRSNEVEFISDVPSSSMVECYLVALSSWLGHCSMVHPVKLFLDHMIQAFRGCASDSPKPIYHPRKSIKNDVSKVANSTIGALDEPKPRYRLSHPQLCSGDFNAHIPRPSSSQVLREAASP